MDKPLFNLLNTIGRLFDRERNSAGNRIRRDCHLVHGVDDLSLHLRIVKDSAKSV
jgi:hypothetical protein